MLRYVIIFSLATFCSAAIAQNISLTTVILVRHAEKGFDEAGDPELNEKGIIRATELNRILRNQPLDAIYSTEFKRTRQTVALLAAEKGLEILDYNPFKIEEVMEIIKNAKGKTILFSGHSNTTPIIINKIIDKEQYQSLDETDYDNFYIVTFTEIGNAKVIELEYGESSNEKKK
jgi:2,3-bisphosphoglycerate-dependent phosphoglycerate mutase